MRRGIKYFSVGAAIGWLLAFFAVVSAGAGHGTYYPAAFFFGPLCALWFALIPNVPEWILTALLVATPFLYGAYSLLVLRGMVTERARQYAIAVLSVHWTGAIIAMVLVYRDESGFSHTLHVISVAAPLIFFEILFFGSAHYLLWRVVQEARRAGRD